MFIEETLNIDYNTALIGFALITAIYVFFGGLLAVMYTDAFQASVMLFGMTAVLIITLCLVRRRSPTGNETLNFMASDPTISAKFPPGMTGWTSLPEFGSNLWFTMVTTIIMGVGIGVLAQPQLVVRFMTAKDDKSLNRAVLIGGHVHPDDDRGGLHRRRADQRLFLGGDWPDRHRCGGKSGQHHSVLHQPAMPEWFVVLFMLTLLAAAMSTLSALFHTMGSAAGHDLWCHLGRLRA